jgi:arylsulfatase A-like enzyme
VLYYDQYLKENGDGGHFTEFYGGLTREGQRIKVGNDKTLRPGAEDTFMSYDLPWANASNTPFRLFKSFVHEGGISTPFVVHFPAAMLSEQHNRNGSINDCGRICHSPWIMMDIVATCCDLAGVRLAPDNIEGESFLPILMGNDDTARRKPIFWEHQGNCAVRDGKWKLVRRRYDTAEELCGKKRGRDSDINVYGWELYNLEDDRTELHDLAFENRERVERMAKEWLEWASRVGAKSWPLNPLPKGERDWSNVPWLW